MPDIQTFLYGKVVARQMKALELGLQAIAEKHHAYFAQTRSKYAPPGEHQPASLAEFVQPRWHNLRPTLWLAPTLCPVIAAECQACFHQAVHQPANQP